MEQMYRMGYVVDDDGNIFNLDIQGKKLSCIGVTVETYNTMKKTAEIATDRAEEFYAEKDKYYNRLVELGDIVKPKTQEEINAELMETNKLLMENLINLSKEMEVLKNGFKQDAGVPEGNGTRPNKNK